MVGLGKGLYFTLFKIWLHFNPGKQRRTCNKKWWAEKSGKLVLENRLAGRKLRSQVDECVKSHVELHQQHLVERNHNTSDMNFHK